MNARDRDLALARKLMSERFPELNIAAALQAERELITQQVIAHLRAIQAEMTGTDHAVLAAVIWSFERGEHVK